MRDAINTWLEIQKSAFETTANVTSMVMRMNARLLDQQLALFRQTQPHRRTHEPPAVVTKKTVAKARTKLKSKPQENPKAKKRKGRTPKQVSPCCGPDLMDHYGKRSTDVDVERI